MIASGGDGTVSGVVTGMVNSQVPMGILPAGTGNALARDLGIPMNMEAALGLIGDDHEIQTMDVMDVNGDYYILNASVGISAEIMLDTPRGEKRKFGMLAYLSHTFRNLVKARMHRFMLTVDDKNYKVFASEVMVANEKFMGLQPRVEGITIDPSDGRLDAFIVRAKSVRDYLDVVLRFLWQRKPEDDPTLGYVEIKDTMTVKSLVPLPVQADGEVIGETPVEIKLVRNALKVIVPGKKK